MVIHCTGDICSDALNGVLSINVMDVCFMLPFRLKRLVYSNRTVSALGLVKN